MNYHRALSAGLAFWALLLLIILSALLVGCKDSGDEEDAPDGSSTSPGSQTSPQATQPSASIANNCPENDAGPPQEASVPGLEGRIVFVRLVFGCNPEVFDMNGDGSGALNLTNDPALDDEGHISPDGSKVVFFSTREGEAILYVVNADGSGLKKLYEQPGGADASPRWSPDGSKIAFSRGGSLAVINADGSDLKVIMESQAGLDSELCHGGSFVGSWSPDGQRITYYSAVVTTDASRYEVCSINADGSNIQVLVSDPVGGLHAEPFWSPDGKMIAFRDDRDGPCGANAGCNYEIYVLDLETGEQRNVSRSPAFDIEPAWSPDSQWIIFASNREDPNFDLYIMRPDGSDVQRLLSDPTAKDSYPSWSP